MTSSTNRLAEGSRAVYRTSGSANPCRRLPIAQLAARSSARAAARYSGVPASLVPSSRTWRTRSSRSRDEEEARAVAAFREHGAEREQISARSRPVLQGMERRLDGLALDVDGEVEEPERGAAALRRYCGVAEERQQARVRLRALARR